MKISLGKKITLLLVIFALALSGVALAVGYVVVDNMNSQHCMNKANEISATLARIVDAQGAEKLKEGMLKIYYSTPNKVGSEDWGSPEFEEYSNRFSALAKTPEYQTLIEQLQNLQEVNSVDCFYLSYVDPVDEKFLCLIDAAEEEPCPIGCIDPLFDFNRGVLDDPTRGFPAYITDTEEYGWLATAGSPVYNSKGEVVCYACVDISMDAIKQQQSAYVTALALGLFGFIALLCVVAAVFVRARIVRPINTLSEAATRYCSPKSNERSTFKDLEINTRDEIQSLHQSMIQMECDIDTYIDNLIKTRAELNDTRIEADHMSDLARTDSLTGIRNKRAYNQEVESLQGELDAGMTDFGLVVVDLNNLKRTNDIYGHDCGDVSIVSLSNTICEVFAHSPVFRIGGDEFVVVLKDSAYNNAQELVRSFEERIQAYQDTDSDELRPWERISAAIGYALYDPQQDENVAGVFHRADNKMYEAKARMKGTAPR